MNIVKFNDGTYGVRKVVGIGCFKRDRFLGGSCAYWWDKTNINIFCKFPTIEEAREAMQRADTSYTVVE